MHREIYFNGKGRGKQRPYGNHMGKFLLCHACFFLLILLTAAPAPARAGDYLSFSGNLALRGVAALNDNSETEYPSLTGRLKIDTPPAIWRFHSWLEGGWDGTVHLPARDRALLKKFDEVYQSSTPFLEFKELYVSYGTNDLELRAGIQRFAWGRLDEYPINDLLNPWDYSRFILPSLEDRKIGVPSLSANLNKGNWSIDLAWIPLFVPYRLPQPNERWFGDSKITALALIPGAEIVPREPDLPPQTFENSGFGLRLRHTGELDWAFSLFHGFDPRPVFTTTALSIQSQAGKILIDPGFVPDFHKTTVLGLDGAMILGGWSLRAEAAWTFNRPFMTRQELWGYPSTPAPGTFPLRPNQVKSDTLDYGIGADYRVIEDCILTVQAQQTVIIDRPETLYERRFETLLWANLKVFWLNQKVETNLNLAYNPEHGDGMARVNGWYLFTDSWKAGVSAAVFRGPAQSLFGRYSRNDQVEGELVYSW